MHKKVPKSSRIGHEILPFEMGYLPEYYQKKAEIELKETPENKQKGLKILREMIDNDKNFQGLTFDEDFLIQYLRVRKYDVKRALSQIKSFVNLRKRKPHLFTNFDFNVTSLCTKNKIVTFLPYRCQDGCAILLIQLEKWDPEEFPAEEVKKMVVIYLLQSVRDPMTQVNGFKIIFDVKTNPVKHLRHATPGNMYLMWHGSQECSAGRFKSIHIVNESITFKVAFTIIKPFLSAKLKNRIHYHSRSEELLDHFPADCIPEQYGGNLKDYDLTPWLYEVMRPEKLETLGGGAFRNSL